ncbi:response regulator [Candidatus Sulfidibacterium hydrothermale]|uniref:hybrid sensor histidine kinase/response regulator transcription factor n=1 Tax=Candidatus Sulfidibacterium hydrothermale TaxID=2875962 RepID=UPI001F0A0BE0|nr:response regulator [Candidatus Sulfidibacterium hydrothermale]UBM63393.1 response regulator [Candidatus Sulfidibacterium hydrothermale]
MKYLSRLLFAGFLAFLFLTGIPSYAEGFRHLSRKDGLSSNRTYGTVEDKEGFLWIATSAGIDRFDGKHFVHYPLEKLEEIASRGFSYNYLLIDTSNNIFVVSNRGYVYRLNRLQDRFNPVKAFSFYNGKYVAAAFLDNNHHLLLGTPNGLVVYDYDRKQFIPTPVKKNVRGILSYGDGYLLGTTNAILWLSKDFKRTRQMGKWNPKLGKNVQVRALSYDAFNKRIWFGTQNTGLYYFDLKKNRYQESLCNVNIKKYPVWDIVQGNDTTMLVGTDGAGLFLVDLRKNEVIKQYTHNPDDEESISSNVIYGILVGREHVYFISTDIGGVDILNPLLPHFRMLRREKGNTQSLRNNVVRAIVEPKPGWLAFGTEKDVSLWDRKHNHWQRLGKISDAGRNRVVTAMSHSDDGSLWVGYFLNNLKIYGPAEKKYAPLPEILLHIRNPKAMYFDNNSQTLWTGRSGRQVRLLSYHFNTRILDRFSLPEVTDLHPYPLDKMLISTRRGLFIVNKNTSDIKKHLAFENKLNRITCLLVDNRQRIWIGSDGGGLAQINLDGKILQLFNEEKGLASNHVYALQEDDNGKLWAATATGLSRIDPSDSGILNYFASDGAVPGEFRYNASCKTRDGQLLFGGTDGVVMFNPATLGKPYLTMNLIFTGLYVNQKKITGASGKILTRPINDARTLHLQYNENSFTITFTNIDFIHPEQARFSWKLEGYDKTWSPVSPVGRTSYSNVPPGDYIFRVRLKPFAISGRMPVERDIRVIISPPIWRTPWAFLFYAALIIAIVLLVLYYNKLMHDMHSARERLRFLVNMAHEIKTPLSLIQAPIGDVIRESKDENLTEKLNMALKNAQKLQNKIGRFLDFKKIDEIKNVRPERMDAVAFVKRKIFAFRMLAEKHQLQLNLETALHKLEVYCDPELLDKILNNLLSNAIKYNKPGGFVNVRIIQHQKTWQIVVTDSGIGIPKKEQKRIFKLFFRASNAVKSQISGSGVGLVLAYDMAKVLKGSLTFKSKEGEGTTFTLTLPIGTPDIHDDVYVDSAEEEESPTSTGTNTEKEDKLKILVVEDDTDLRNYIQKVLQKEYQVLVCSNGQEAWLKVQQQLPDLVLSDVAMPRMNGRQLCINIKSNASTSHIPVILLSGLSSQENILQGLEAGADDYITKPFDSSILMAKIKTLLLNRKALKEKFIHTTGEGMEFEFKNEFDKAFVKKITTLVEENIADPDLSVRMLYSAAGMSRTAFYHKLKSLIDMSPAEFIRMIRLNHAKKLLLTRRFNVNEVAYRCGFTDAKYFSTSFKRQFGKSPSSFLTDQKK